MSRDKGPSLNRRAFFGVAATGAAAAAVGTGGARPVIAQTGDEYYRTNRYYPRGGN